MQFKSALILFAVGTLHGLHAKEAAAPELNDPKAPATPRQTFYDKIWGLATLYHNLDNPIIQEFRLRGRQHNEWYYCDAAQGQDEDWINRRTRIGFQARMFDEFTLHSEVDFVLQDQDPLYNRITDAHVAWSPSKTFTLKVGKQSARFTLDGSTSSLAIYTIDRSQIANNFWFPEEYSPGVSVTGEMGKWIYNVGYFSSGEASPEFGDFNAGNFGVISLGYHLAETLHVDTAVVRADFVYQDEHPGNAKGKPNPFTRNHEMVGSLNFRMEEGRFGLGTDLVASRGYLGQPDLFGVQFMPSLYLDEAKKFQIVFRYTYINSHGDNGIRFARYENRIVSGRGDEYNEFYVGLNWYLYGHNLKFQTGVQYTTMDDNAGDGGDYDGWGVTNALRISW